MPTGFAGLGIAMTTQSGCELARALRMVSAAWSAESASSNEKVCVLPVVGSVAVTRCGTLGGGVSAQR